MNAIEKRCGAAKARLFVLSALASALCSCLLNFTSDAATWPATDNLPAVCRSLDSGCLANDFFTNASAGLTPRLPYIYFLGGVTRAAGHGIAGGLPVVKALLMALLPALFSAIVMASVVALAAGRNQDAARPGLRPSLLLAAMAAPVLVFLFQGELGALLSVAWWKPLALDATPHNLSLLLTLAGFSFIGLGAGVAGAVFVFAGGIFHPVVGLFATAFCCVLLCSRKSIQGMRRALGLGLGASMAAAILISVVFGSGGALSAGEFVRIYAIEAHPSHYLPSQFGALSALPWQASFAAVLAGLAAAAIVLYRQGSTACWNALLALIAYLGAVALQYLFVEVYPVKLVAALGPSRFTMFGPWFLLAFFLLAVARPVDGNRRLGKFAGWCERVLLAVHWRHIGFASVPLAALVVAYAVRPVDLELADRDSRELARFAVEKTRTEDVFALPFDAPRVEFPLKTGRALFHGNGFPFAEKYFAEWDARNAFINGGSSEIAAYPDSWIGGKYARHYRLLKPADFLRAAAAYRLDWVVVESNYAGEFARCKADFNSAKYRAYSRDALRAC
jgi:hypothetical protein